MTAIRNSLTKVCQLAAATVACAAISVGSAWAGKISVSDAGSGNLSLDVVDSTVSDVLGALSKQYGFKVEGSAGDSAKLSGELHGNLPQVIHQLLQRDDYVIVYYPDRAEGLPQIDTVTVLGSHGGLDSISPPVTPYDPSSVGELLTQSAFVAAPSAPAESNIVPINTAGSPANRADASRTPETRLPLPAALAGASPAVPAATNTQANATLAEMTRAASANVQSLAQALQRVTEQMATGRPEFTPMASPSPPPR